MIAIAPIHHRSNVRGLELLLAHEPGGKHIDRQIQELSDRVTELERLGVQDGWLEARVQRNRKRYYYLCRTGKRDQYIRKDLAADVQADIERWHQVRRLKSAIVRLEEWRAEYADILI